MNSISELQQGLTRLEARARGVVRIQRSDALRNGFQEKLSEAKAALHRAAALGEANPPSAGSRGAELLREGHDRLQDLDAFLDDAEASGEDPPGPRSCFLVRRATGPGRRPPASARAR